MTEPSENPPKTNIQIEEPPELPPHKKLFDEFVSEARNSEYIMDFLFQCWPDLNIQPSDDCEDEKVINIEIGHDSEIANKVDWLGGGICKEKISFNIQNDGSLLRIIEIAPKTNSKKIKSMYINANLGAGKARDFTEYILNEPSEDLEGILPFLEIDDEEKQEIALLHQKHRREFFVVNSAISNCEDSGNS